MMLPWSVLSGWNLPHSVVICAQCDGGPTPTTPTPLKQGRLVLEDGKGLLQTLNLGCAAPTTLLIGLRSGDATRLDLGIVLQNSAELSVLGRTVGCQLGDGLVQPRGLFGLVLDILHFQSRGHLVLLRHLLVFRLG